MKMGSVIIIMLTCSTKRPRKISTSIIAAMSASGGRPSVAMISTIPLLAPEGQDLREGRRADDDEEDHSRDARRAAQREHQILQGKRPVGRGEQDCEQCADR